MLLLEKINKKMKKEKFNVNKWSKSEILALDVYQTLAGMNGDDTKTNNKKIINKLTKKIKNLNMTVRQILPTEAKETKNDIKQIMRVNSVSKKRAIEIMTGQK